MHDRDELAARVKPLLGDMRKVRWLAPLVRKLSLEFAEAPRPLACVVADRIRSHDGYVNAWAAGNGRVAVGAVTPRMAPAAGAPRTWAIPQIPTLGALAELLRLHPDDLGWLVSYSRAEHYRYRWQAKARSGRFRLIESPKLLLKSAQRQALRKILTAIPPHEAARGFRTGCSVLDFVKPHTGRDVVIRFDLEDFFPSVTAARIVKTYLTAGCPEAVARALARLTTHAAPPAVMEERLLSWPERRRLATPHLPQGAPTSPALANLAAFRLDCRLAGLAQAAGAGYTRYADDLLFSGGEDFARQARRFEVAVGAVIIEEGFRPNHRKTRVLRQGRKQHAAGLVLNEKPNIDRREFDRLKAVLTNCVRHGPASQNRENHPEFAASLSGRLAWVRFVNPEKEAKLREIYQRIDWSR
jgi:hypothetical protein